MEKITVMCPWGFLGGTLSTEKSNLDALQTKEIPAQRRTVSFSDKVHGEQPQHLDVEDLPTPEMKGNMPSIKLPKQAVERGRQYCKYCLIGRLDFHKIKLEDVKSMAAIKWKSQGDWKIIPLGKGFFMIRLTCEQDWRKIWGGGPWNFGEQTLRLTKWSPDFDPDVQTKTNAAVWIKFPKLGQQYWDYEILMSMGRAFGSPVGVDKHTLDRTFGNFASVLVDVDLSKPIPSQFLVEEDEGKSFLQDAEVIRLPKFCGHCKSVGHLVAECKGLQKEIRREEALKEVTHPEPTKQKKKRSRNRNNQKEQPGASGVKNAQGIGVLSQEDVPAAEALEGQNMVPVLVLSPVLEAEVPHIFASTAHPSPVEQPILVDVHSKQPGLAIAQAEFLSIVEGLTPSVNTNEHTPAKSATRTPPPVNVVASPTSIVTPVHPTEVVRMVAVDKGLELNAERAEDPVNAKFVDVTLVDSPNIGSSTSISRSSAVYSANCSAIQESQLGGLVTPKNRFKVLEEADKLLQSGNWADQVEEEEWQVQTKKGYKSLKQVQVQITPNSGTRSHPLKE
ncbi:hypothetical protein IFM89_004814 [Coptis chinensis]|uniref:DUF4283 domain-containing protein n=1 Tax=Coptis chinensis TaxID=261450 RepID=A0A835IV36_9MAGN|nr:hypothetical protein IFM89_004814 [Coptis chinensis]